MARKKSAGVKITVTEVGGRGVQGVGFSLDDLTLLGQKWRASVGDALVDGTLERTIEGASTLTLNLHDHDRELLESELLQASFDVELDGLGFSFVKASSSGITAPLALTFEDREVARLRSIMGPAKAFRDKLTRAEFLNRSRLVAAKGWGPIPFFAYQLHKEQPIATARQSRAAKVDTKSNRGAGVDQGANLTVKGAPATAGQIAMGDRVMRIATSLGARVDRHRGERAQMALVTACIVESQLSNIGRGTGSSRGVLQVTAETASGLGIDPMDVEACVQAFLLKGFTGNGGALELARQFMPVPEICQAVQGSNVPSAYAQWAEEGHAWVEAFRGGSAGSISVSQPQRYAFEIKKTEDYWAGMQRLAGEVKWRLFASAGKLYYVPEPYLMRAMVRARVDDLAPGIEDISFEYDKGKPINEVTVQARAKSWAAPPGSVCVVARCGPANGRYLVSSISAPLRHRNSVCDVTLKRPGKPLDEPTPKTKTKTFAGHAAATASSATGMGILKGTPEDVVNEVVAYAAAHGFSISPQSVTAANATHGPTVTGGTSDHQGPPNVRWAADISNGTTTPEETHLAAAIAKAFNIPWSGSGLVTKQSGHYRMQLIYKTMEGGNHFDHVHFGCSVA